MTATPYSISELSEAIQAYDKKYAEQKAEFITNYIETKRHANIAKFFKPSGLCLWCKRTIHLESGFFCNALCSIEYWTRL